METNEVVKATLKYLKSEIRDYKLPNYFKEFLTQIHEIFPEEQKLYIVYNHEKKKNGNQTEKMIEVKNKDDFGLMITRLQKKEIKNNEILIETDEIPAGINRKVPENFDENIKCVVERELKIAAENIKKALAEKKNNINGIKKHDEKCSKCDSEIIGNLYKDVLEEDKYYCEKCSTESENPVFILP